MHTAVTAEELVWGGARHPALGGRLSAGAPLLDQGGGPAGSQEAIGV